MGKIFVAGLINIETTLKIDQFPLAYFPVCYPFFGVNKTISGVGYNVAKALAVLGDDVKLCALIGQDDAGWLIKHRLELDKLDAALVFPLLKETAQSVIIFDEMGKRQIHTDLKDIQDKAVALDVCLPQIAAADLAVMCNINFSRALLKPARELGKWIATDVHVLRDLNDDYNQDYLRQAQILFLSGDGLPCTPEEYMQAIMGRFNTEIVVMGLGAEGALLGVNRDGLMKRFSAVQTRHVVNTIGAGDALFSCFVHDYVRTKDAEISLQRAMVFASYKIGANGGASGFLSNTELDQWVQTVYG